MLCAVHCGGDAVGGDSGLPSDATTDTVFQADVGSDAPVTSDVQAVPDATAADTGCPAIDGGAPYVIVMDVAAGPPPAGGGPITLGRYYATEISKFTGDGGASGPDPFYTDPLSVVFEFRTDVSGADRIDSTGTRNQLVHVRRRCLGFVG